MILGHCLACSRQSVRYDRDRIEVISCPACGWFMTSRQPEYNATHNRCFPPLDADEQQDLRAAQVERVTDYFAGRCLAISPRAVAVKVPARADDERR